MAIKPVQTRLQEDLIHFLFFRSRLGLEVWIGRRQRGTDFITPVMKTLAKLIGFVGQLPRQVCRLAQIVFQVVQLDVVIFEVLQQFPIALSNCADRRRRGVVVRVMKKQRIPIELWQPGPSAAASDRDRPILHRDRRHASRGEQRGKQVHHHHRLVALGPLGRHARPADHQRHADASFVARAFAAAQRCVVRHGHRLTRFPVHADESAIVTGKDNDRVLLQSAFIQMCSTRPTLSSTLLIMAA